MDSWVLYSPAGTALQLASYINVETDVDFGEADLLKAQFSENSMQEGGELAFESVGIRHFSFPLRVASNAFGSLQAQESLLRLSARPGAWIDLQPDGVPSAESVRFDIRAGRYELNYSTRMNAIDRRDGTLKLDVPPFGYWPTMILLASAASIGLPGTLVIPNASIIGDAPGWGQVDLTTNMNINATNYPAGTWLLDSFMWSLAARPSFNARISGASFVPGPSMVTGVVGDKFAPGSQAYLASVSPTIGAWAEVAHFEVASGLEPAYRGHHRLFGWFNLGPSQAYPWQLTADVVTRTINPALGSAGIVATLNPAVSSGPAQASPAYTLLDLGEITIPPWGPSGPSAEVDVRIWTSPPTSNVGIANPQLTIGGLYLLPLDGPAGVMARGIVQPTIANNPTTIQDYNTNYSWKANPAQALSGFRVDLMTNYRGRLPLVGASTNTIEVCGGARRVGVVATAPLVRSDAHFARVGVSYTPRFTFMKGL